MHHTLLSCASLDLPLVLESVSQSTRVAMQLTTSMYMAYSSVVLLPNTPEGVRGVRGGMPGVEGTDALPDTSTTNQQLKFELKFKLSRNHCPNTVMLMCTGSLLVAFMQIHGSDICWTMLAAQV
jgi:hypothetical protein